MRHSVFTLIPVEEEKFELVVDVVNMLLLHLESICTGGNGNGNGNGNEHNELHLNGNLKNVTLHLTLY